MNASRIRFGSRLPRKQRGIAAILIILLTGLSLSAAVLGVMSRMNSTQEQSVALSAQTQAQIKTWMGAKVLHEYLVSLDTDDPIPNPATDLNPDGLTGITVQMVPPAPTAGDQTQQFFFDVVGVGAEGTRAEARSRLRVVYERILPSPPTGGRRSRAVLNFHNDLNITGSINVAPEPGQTYDINVAGNVNITNVGVTGIEIVKSAKSIRFQGGSSTDITELHSSCDVMVANAGGFAVQVIKATNNVCVINTASSNMVQANGSVQVTGGRHGTLYARADVDPGVAACAADAENHCTIDSDFGIKVDWSTPVSTGIFTKGSVFINEFVNTLNVQVERDFISSSCPGANGLASVRLGGKLNLPGWCNTTYPISAEAVSVPIVQPITMGRETFDSNSLREMANYLFARHASATRVKVRNVHGMPAHDQAGNPESVREHGYYYRSANIIDPANPGWTGRMVSNYACVNASASSNDKNNCWRLAEANNNDTSLPAYSAGNNTWTMNGRHAAPGVWFFEGNLIIQNGYYTNTLIATGNIALASSGNAVVSLNWAGASGNPITQASIQGVCENNRYGLYPGPFCGSAVFDYGAFGGLGNYGLMAGSCPASSPGKCTPGEYIGGNISVAGYVYGAIKAGNLFSTSGNTNIYGYATGLAQRTSSSSESHSFGNTTNFILSNLPAGYDPTAGRTDDDNPDPGGPSPGGPSPGGPGSSVTLRWSRFL